MALPPNHNYPLQINSYKENLNQTFPNFPDKIKDIIAKYLYLSDNDDHEHEFFEASNILTTPSNLNSNPLVYPEYLILCQKNLDKKSLMNAAVIGKLDVVQYLIDIKGIQPDAEVLASAAVSGKLDLVRYLIDVKGIQPDTEVLASAAASGKLDLVQYLIDVKGMQASVADLVWAATSGNLDLVQYLIDVKGIKIDKGVLIWAAGSGNLNIVQYLIAVKGIKIDKEILAEAIARGNFNSILDLMQDDAQIQKANAKSLDKAQIEQFDKRISDINTNIKQLKAQKTEKTKSLEQLQKQINLLQKKRGKAKKDAKGHLSPEQNANRKKMRTERDTINSEIQKISKNILSQESVLRDLVEKL